VTGISERIRRVRNELAPAERRVVEALLDDYPLAGLGSVGDLATAAKVSAPTVLRLVAKLGFGGYPEFREHVRGEVAARLFSPVEAYPRAEEHGGDLLATAERRYAEAVHATFRGLDPGEVERAVATLCDLERRLRADGAAVGVGDEHDRSLDRLQHARDVRGVTRRAAQLVGRGDDRVPAVLQAIGHGSEAGGVGEGAVDEDDRRLGLTRRRVGGREEQHGRDGRDGEAEHGEVRSSRWSERRAWRHCNLTGWLADV